MAKKKEAKNQMPLISEPEADAKPVRLDLKASDHRILRLMAAHNDKSMASYARDVLLAAMQLEAKEKGIKL